MHGTGILDTLPAPLAGWHDPDGGAANQSRDTRRHGLAPGPVLLRGAGLERCSTTGRRGVFLPVRWESSSGYGQR